MDMKRAISHSICALLIAGAALGCSILSEVRGMTSQLDAVYNGMTVPEVEAKCGVPQYAYESGGYAILHYINMSQRGTIRSRDNLASMNETSRKVSIRSEGEKRRGGNDDYLLIFEGGVLTGRQEVTAEITGKRQRDSEELRLLCGKARQERYSLGRKKYCED